MSADLFAEFSSNPSAANIQAGSNSQRSAQPASTFSFFDDLSSAAPAPATPSGPVPANYQNFSTAPAQTPADDDNDDWGDFEGESTTVQDNTPSGRDPFAFTTAQPAQTLWNQPASTKVQFDFPSTQSHPYQPSQATWQKAPVVKAKKSADPSVLFDAEDDFGDDDDFGDFEGTGSVIATPAPAPAIDSLSLVDLLGDVSVSQPTAPVPSSRSHPREVEPTKAAQKTVSATRKVPIGRLGVASKVKQSSTIAKAAERTDDGWDTFDDWEATIPTKTSIAMKTEKKSSLAKATVSGEPRSTPTLTPILSPTCNDPQPGELPPTNVPPPGVLLSLFPALFSEAQEKLFKPMAAQTLPMRNKLLAEPGTIRYLQGYLMLANVAAHIIAGRKLRWKRDQHLSQGMRIGPASSRATSGMKLTGIDKGENLKEEREASDVVRVWKDQIGRLRHVVSGANQIRAGTLGAVPDVQETMPVKMLKQSEGGVPARQACMLCGLKRDERVTAGDMRAEDSFGEWWVEQVNMHRGMLLCRWCVCLRGADERRQGAEISGGSTRTGFDSAEGEGEGDQIPQVGIEPSTWTGSGVVAPANEACRGWRTCMLGLEAGQGWPGRAELDPVRACEGATSGCCVVPCFGVCV